MLLMNSTIYHRQCKLREYVSQIRKLDDIIRAMDGKSTEWCTKLRKSKLRLCRYTNVDDGTFTAAFRQMLADYTSKKTRYSKNQCTLYDICLRDLAARFKGVFSNTGTHSILLAFYEYVDKLPSYIQVMGKPLSEHTVAADCYFRHYINVFFCYDVAVNLVENYRKLTDMSQMICLEMLINDILFLVNVIFVDCCFHLFALAVICLGRYHAISSIEQHLLHQCVSRCIHLAVCTVRCLYLEQGRCTQPSPMLLHARPACPGVYA